MRARELSKALGCPIGRIPSPGRMVDAVRVSDDGEAEHINLKAIGLKEAAAPLPWPGMAIVCELPEGSEVRSSGGRHYATWPGTDDFMADSDGEHACFSPSEYGVSWARSPSDWDRAVAAMSRMARKGLDEK